jgi:molybdopterin/thiamine biosynthesis adenylyltransferase/uncharacterized ubiquitin-like protein YukD
MAYITIQVWGVSDNKKDQVELPDDVPIKRLIVLLVDRLKYPQYDSVGGQLLSYKLHHSATRKQLIDDRTLAQSEVKDGDVVRLMPEIIAGAVHAAKADARISHPHETAHDRFARFRLIGWWEQQRLQRAKVVVVGAGALGNEILKNLALLGIGNILIIDFDVIEDSNLSRSILFRAADSGLRKCEIAARAVKEIYPAARVHWLCADVIHDIGLGVYRWADVVLTGLDSREARLAVNQSCWRTNTPWINGAIEGLSGVAQSFIPPDSACYECTMGAVDWQIVRARKGCNSLTREDLLMGKVPTTPTSASVIAAIQCQEAVKLLHGLDVLAGRGFVFNGLTHNSYVVEYERQDECCAHDTFDDVKMTGRSTSTTSIGTILAEVKAELGPKAVVEFNNDVVEALICPTCGSTEAIFRPLGRVTEDDGLCRQCGTMRNPTIFKTVSGAEEFLAKSLSEIGVPPYEIIAGRAGQRRMFLEFDADAPQVLGPLAAASEPDHVADQMAAV